MNLEALKQLDKKYAQAIAAYLLERIETDQCLKEKLETTEKTLKGCVEYCKSEARKQAEDGCAIIPKEEVFEWCVHYFLEDSLDYEPKAVEPKEEKPKEEKKPKVKKVETLFGEEEIVIEKKKPTPKVEKPKKDVKEDFEEQLSLFDL